MKPETVVVTLVIKRIIYVLWNYAVSVKNFHVNHHVFAIENKSLMVTYVYGVLTNSKRDKMEVMIYVG